MLKHLLIKYLAFIPLWASHMFTQIVAMLDLGNTLITHGLKARYTSLNIYMDLMMVLMTLELMGTLVSFRI